MPPDNLLDSIQIISDGISEINYRLADTLPSANGYNELETERDQAVDRFHFLVKLFFKDSTQRYIRADSTLALVNAEMKNTLDKLQNMQDVIDTVTRFVAAIDTFIGAVSKTI